jgi:hypothetical protein
MALMQQQQQMAAASTLNMQMQHILSYALTNSSRQVGMQGQATSRGSSASSTCLVPALTRAQEHQMQQQQLPTVLLMLSCTSSSSSSSRQ